MVATKPTFPGSNGSAPPAPWTSQSVVGTSAATQQSGKLRLLTSGTSGDGLNETYGVTFTGGFYFLARVTPRQTWATEQYLGMGWVDDPAAATAGYILEWDAHAPGFFGFLRADTGAPLAGSLSKPGPSGSNPAIIEVLIQNGRVRANAWDETVATPGSGTWQVDVASTLFTGSYKPYLWVGTGAGGVIGHDWEALVFEDLHGAAAEPSFVVGYSTIGAGVIGGPTSIGLTVADGTHAHTTDGIDLVQHNILVVADGAHTDLADAAPLTQHNVLVVADADHTDVADNVSPFGLHFPIAVDDATHGHSTDGVDLVQHNVLVVADGNHTDISDGIALTQHNVLVVADGAHTDVADNITPVTHYALAVADGAHAHAGDSVVLAAGVAHLVVADGTHAHAADGALNLIALPWFDPFTGVDNSAPNPADWLVSSVDGPPVTPPTAVIKSNQLEMTTFDLGYVAGIRVDRKNFSTAHQEFTGDFTVENPITTHRISLIFRSGDLGLNEYYFELAHSIGFIEFSKLVGGTYSRPGVGVLFDFDPGATYQFIVRSQGSTHQLWIWLLGDPTLDPDVDDPTLEVVDAALTAAGSVGVQLYGGDGTSPMKARFDNLGGAGLGMRVQDSLHGHSADNITLHQAAHLIVADALNAHSADNIGFGQHSVLIVADAFHGDVPDNIGLNGRFVQKAFHAHTADSPVLGVSLHPADAFHGLSSRFRVGLAHLDSHHNHSADKVVLHGREHDGYTEDTDPIGLRTATQAVRVGKVT